MKLKDDVCEFCEIKDHCHTIKSKCAPLTWVDGDKPRKETLLRDIAGIDSWLWDDPNATISTLIDDRAHAFDNIERIKDYRIRLIASGLLAGIPKVNIGELMGLTERRIQQLTSHK